jgi:hypothetical protein
MTYTHETIGELLPHLTPRKVPSAVKAGLPGRKIGKVWYFDEDAVRQWMSVDQHIANVRAVRRSRRHDDPNRYPDVGD